MLKKVNWPGPLAVTKPRLSDRTFNLLLQG